MSNAFKKIATVALLALVLVTGVVVDAPKASAATAAELQAQLAALQAQLAALQGSSQTCTFTRSLTVGSRGADVTCLQDYLRAGGHLSVASTGYFGPLTRAAVARWQAANGVSPAVGYFGPLSRAKYVSLTAVVVVPPVTPTPTPTPTPVPPVVTGLTVSVGANNPVAATIIADTTGAQALIPALSLRFTGNGTVNTLRFVRTGISGDSDIDNVYLFEADGKTRIADMSSMSGGVVTFTSGSGLFTVAGERTVVVRYDLNRNASAGKTIAFSLNSAADVVGSVAVNGSFPITGNNMTVAVVTDLARLTLTGQTTATSVDPGSTAFEAFKFQLQAQDQNVKVWSIKLTGLGSVDNAHLANFKLWDGGTQVGSTVTGTAADKTVTFDFGANPFTISSGVTRNMRVTVDVVGGATRTIQLSLQRAADILATDANYNVNIKTDNGTVGTFAVTSSTSATINSGSVTVNLSPTSPAGNVALNATDVELARYDVKAVGEDIRVSSVVIRLALTTATNLKDVKVVYDGSQVGTTQASVATATDTTITTNFTLPAGVTKTLSIRGSIASASGAGDPLANNDTIVATLKTGSSNAQRLTSLGTFNFPTSDIAGNTLTVSTSTLTGAKNTSVGNLTLTKGTVQARIASFLMTAGAAEGVDVSSIVLTDSNGTLNTAGSQSLGDAFQNLNAFNGSTKLNATTVTTSTSDAAGATYTLSFSPSLSIPANTTVQVDIKADVLSAATWTTGDAVELDSATGTGKITGSSANIATTAGVVGQTITVATAGTLTVTVDSTSPVATQHVMGSTGRTLAVWRFEANTTEDLTVNQLITVDASADNTGGNVKNLAIFVDGVQVGTTVPALDSATGGKAVFGSPSTNLFTVPKGTAKLVTLKADITAFADGAVSGKNVRFKITPPTTITGVSSEGVIARGGSGNFAVVATASQNTAQTANAQFVYRTTFTATMACGNNTCTHARGANDKVVTYTLTGASSAAPINASADSQIRAALNNSVDTATGWTCATSCASAPATTTARHIDGTAVTATLHATTAAVGDRLVFDNGAAVDYSVYKNVSFWIRTSNAKAASDLTFVAASASDLTTNAVAINLPAILADVWTYVDLTNTFAATNTRFIGVRVAANADQGDVMTIDQINFYNDSITVDVSGEIKAIVNGLKFTLQLAGTDVGAGYAANVTADTAFSVEMFTTTTQNITAGTAKAYDVLTNTSTLVDDPGTGTDTISFSSDLGTASASGTITAGDFVWWDQAISGITPITWLSPAPGVSTPISATLSY